MFELVTSNFINYFVKVNPLYIYAKYGSLRLSTKKNCNNKKRFFVGAWPISWKSFEDSSNAHSKQEKHLIQISFWLRAEIKSKV